MVVPFYTDFTPLSSTAKRPQTAWCRRYPEPVISSFDKFNRIKTIFTIPNIAYQEQSTAPIFWKTPAASAAATSISWSTMAAPTS